MCSTSLRLVLEVWRISTLQPALTQAFSPCLDFVLPRLKVLIAHQDPHVHVQRASGCAITTELGIRLADDTQTRQRTWVSTERGGSGVLNG